MPTDAPRRRDDCVAKTLDATAPLAYRGTVRARRCLRRLQRLRRLAALRHVALLVASMAATLAWSSVGVTDDSGQTVALETPARRIISLAPHITEMLYAVGAGNSVIGTVEPSDYPEQARLIPRVGNGGLLDMERIVALRPDLIVVWWHGGFERQLEQLRSLGVPVFYSEPTRLADIPRTLLSFGQLSGNSVTARDAANGFTVAVDRLRLRYAAAPEVSVFYQVWDRPLLTIDHKHIIDDVIRLCGGRNIFADMPALVPTVSVEAVVSLDPEAIVTSTVGGANDGLAMWRSLPTLRAVASNNLIVLDANVISRQSPRIVEGAKDLCEKLQGVRARRRK